MSGPKFKPIDFNPMSPLNPEFQKPKPANNYITYETPLDNFGAPGFSIQERVDFSGHNSGRVDPHVNVDLVNPSQQKVDFFKKGVGDLCNNQIPGFNGMQNLFKK